MLYSNLKPQTSKLTWPIVGHKRITQFLENQIASKTISQAYLFVGPSSLGKSTLAKFFAQTLLCQTEEICETCFSCQSFSKNLHPDLLWVENKNSPLSIEIVRDLRRKISLLPSLSKRKIIVFEEASYLTLEAQNALLKTLEEPPKYAVIILVSQKELLPTILSRCTVLNFQSIPEKEIKKELLEKGFQEDQAFLLAHLSLGQIGKVLKNHSFLEKWEKNLEVLLHLSSSPLKDKINFVKNENPEFLSFWLSIFRDLLLLKTNPAFLKSYSSSLFLKISPLSSFYQTKQVYSLIKKIQEVQNLSSSNINQKLLLENLVLGLPRMRK